MAQRVRQSTLQEDDDDEWVEEDEVIPEIEVIEKGFEHFFDDDKSEASWGTNNTKYTEFVSPSTQSTATSSNIILDPITLWTDDMEDLIKEKMNDDCEIIVAGDFNKDLQKKVTLLL